MTLKQTKEHALYLVINEGSCDRYNTKVCKDDICPNARTLEYYCTHKSAYDSAVEWLYNNGYKEDLVEVLI